MEYPRGIPSPSFKKKKPRPEKILLFAQNLTEDEINNFFINLSKKCFYAL